jgi:hypothetical protein
MSGIQRRLANGVYSAEIAERFDVPGAGRPVGGIEGAGMVMARLHHLCSLASGVAQERSLSTRCRHLRCRHLVETKPAGRE